MPVSPGANADLILTFGAAIQLLIVGEWRKHNQMTRETFDRREILVFAVSSLLAEGRIGRAAAAEGNGDRGGKLCLSRLGERS
jgi:hypothetical protein